MGKVDIDLFSKSVHNNSALNILLRGCGILLALWSTRLNIAYLGGSIYGLWVTIASVASWANSLDLGIGNGLRNELAKAVAEGNTQRQKNLIITAVLLLSKVSVILFVILSIVTELLFAFNIMQTSLRMPMYTTNFFFCVSLVLGISNSVAYAYQRSWLASLSQTTITILQIVGVISLMSLSICPDLEIFSVVHGLCSICGNIIIILILRNSINRKISETVRGAYDPSQRSVIVKMGLQFFILQICGVILYATDNVLINKLFDSISVMKYSVITSIYMTGSSLFSLLLISLWSATTYVASLEEYGWIKKEIRYIKKLWCWFALGTIIVSLLLNNIVSIWLGENAVHYEVGLILVFAGYTLLSTFGSIYVNVANGLGRVKLQMTITVIGAAVNIPLSIFLASNCGLGLAGIKLATLLCCSVNWIMLFFDIPMFLNKKKNDL